MGSCLVLRSRCAAPTRRRASQARRPSLTYWQQVEKKMRRVLHALLSGIQQCAVAISPI
jgi:hypothetical protein